GGVLIYDVKTGKVVRRLEEFPFRNLFTIIDGKTALVGTLKRKLLALDVGTGAARPLSSLAEFPPISASVIAGGKLVVVPGKDTIVTVELKTGKAVGPTIRAPEGAEFRVVAPVGDGQFLLAASRTITDKGGVPTITGGDLRLIERVTGKTALLL